MLAIWSESSTGIGRVRMGLSSWPKALEKLLREKGVNLGERKIDGDFLDLLNTTWRTGSWMRAGIGSRSSSIARYTTSAPGRQMRTIRFIANNWEHWRWITR